MKKQWVIIAILLAVIFIWFLLTADCVVNRINSGISVDWANIKDCSY